MFGRQDTLNNMGYNRCNANILRVCDWDTYTNDMYIKCAINHLDKGGVYVCFTIDPTDLKDPTDPIDLKNIFEKDFSRRRDCQPSNNTPEFVYELGQLLITANLKLADKQIIFADKQIIFADKQIIGNFIKYKIVPSHSELINEHDTCLLKKIVSEILKVPQSGGHKKQIKLLGKTRNIHYIRAKKWANCRNGYLQR
jgi:hypothetical protein